MFNLLELYEGFDSYKEVYRDAREYANGEKSYPTSPYMREYYKSLLPELALALKKLKDEITRLEKTVGVKS